MFYEFFNKSPFLMDEDKKLCCSRHRPYMFLSGLRSRSPEPKRGTEALNLNILQRTGSVSFLRWLRSPGCFNIKRFIFRKHILRYAKLKQMLVLKMFLIACSAGVSTNFHLNHRLNATILHHQSCFKIIKSTHSSITFKH